MATIGIIGSKIVGATGKFGGASHYSEFEADGTLKMTGNATVWRDINIDLGPFRGGATAPTFAEVRASSGIYGVAMADGDEISGCFEIPHEVLLSSAMTPHVHFIPTGTVTAPDNCKFQLLYQLISDGGTFSASSSSLDTGNVAIGTQWVQQRCDFTANITNAAGVGAHLYYTFRRIAASGDNYAGTIHVGTFGLHVECDVIGSRQIGTK